MMQEYSIVCRNFTLQYTQGLTRLSLDNVSDQTHDTSKRWQLGPINLEIKKGEKVAILGRSGSGKSSLLKALQYENLMSKEYFYRGSISTGTLKCVSILQEPKAVLNPLKSVYTLFRDLSQTYKYPFARSMSKSQIMELLEEFDLRDRSILYKRPGELSGGMSQRIMIAMACALLPDLILADEITSSLDTKNEKKIMGYINSHVDTLCFITHRLYLIKDMCSRVIFLKEGNILFDGSMQAFLSSAIPELHTYIESLNWAER